MSQVSRHQVYLAALAVSRQDVDGYFKPRQLRGYLDCSDTAICQHLARMAEDGQVERIYHGVYELTTASRPQPFRSVNTEPDETPDETPDVETSDVETSDERTVYLLTQARAEHVRALHDLRMQYDDAVIAERLSFETTVLDILDA